MNKKINVFIRGLTLAIKFCFIVYAAKLMSPEDFSTFGLYLVLVGYGILVLGFEFHTFSNREIAISYEKNKSELVDNFFSIFFMAYICLIILCLALATIINIPLRTLVLLTLLLISEHLSQEISRLLITQSRQNNATLLIFVRSASWCFFATPCIYLFPENSLGIILKLWLGGSICSVLIGFFYLKKINLAPRVIKINLRWIADGVGVSASMFLVSATTQFFFTFDRFLVNMGSDHEIAAAYTLYIASAMSLISLIDAGVVDFYKQRLFLSVDKSDSKEFKYVFNSFKREVIVASTVLSIFMLILMFILTELMNKAEYSDHIIMMPIIVLAIYFFMLAIIPNTALYLLKKEFFIIKIQFLGLFIFSMLSFLGLILLIQHAVPWALLSTMFIMFLLKQHTANKLLISKFKNN